MLRPVEVKPMPGYHIWLRYADGVSGRIDLSHLAGKGVFEIWDEPGFFERVYISSHRTISWGSEIDICADALYMELTGKTVEEVMPAFV